MASNQSSNTQNSSLLKVQILIVDDDSTSLSIVSAMLKTCSFKDERKLELTVVTVKNPFDALSTLRLKRGVFDLVVTDLHMPEMDGMELQKQVDEEFKLPVIIMSSDDSENVILKSLEGGAAFYIVKPANKDDLKNVWQYAVATKTGNTLLIKEIAATQEPSSSTLVEKTCIEEVNSATSMNDEKFSKIDGRKRNRPPKRKKDDQEVDSQPALKKSKVVWTNSLHNRFLQAINHIGLDKAVPKKILEFMSVPGLSRENVASHLQKYRIFLKKVAERGCSSSKSLSLRTLRSTFAASQPSLIFRNVQQDQYRQFPRQQAVSRASIQPSFGGSILSASALRGSNSGRLHSSNQLQAPNSVLQSPYNQSRSFGNPITGFQANQTRSGVLESNMSSHGNAPNGISGISTMQMYQQQNQARLSSTLQNGSSPYNRFGPAGIQTSNNHGYGVGSFGNVNNSLNTNNNYAGIRVTTNGQLIGGAGGQTGGNYSGMMNLVAQNGNMNSGACMGVNIASVSNYMTQREYSFSTGFESANQFPPTSFGGIINYQGNNAPMLPPLLPQQLGVRNGGQNHDYAFGLMNNTLSPVFGGNSNNQQQQLGQGELNVNDMLLEPTNNLPAYQPQGVVDHVSSPLHELLNPDFFNSLHIDDNTPWNEQPSSQVQNGEGTVNPNFGGNASSMDGYFPNLYQQRGNDDPMDSELSGAHYPTDNGPTGNQGWDDDFLESLFGNEPFPKE